MTPEQQPTIGFIGLGRLGLPIAANLIASGYDVVGPQRGRREEFEQAGGRIAGDGSARAVAREAAIILTCLPDDAALESVIDEILDGAGSDTNASAPIVIELSTVSIQLMERLRARLAERGGDLLDCPVSGTPATAAERKAVIFVSGERAAHARVAEIIKAIAPANVFVGGLGAGTNFKYVANLLAFVHVTVAAEAMAFAAASGLDLNLVAGVISRSAPATSGQFDIRAPLMAQGNFESTLVTVDQMREVCAQIVAHADQIGAATPLITVVRDLYEEFAATGEGGSDPGKLVVYLQEKASAHAR